LPYDGCDLSIAGFDYHAVSQDLFYHDLLSDPIALAAGILLAGVLVLYDSQAVPGVVIHHGTDELQTQLPGGYWDDFRRSVSRHRGTGCHKDNA
jgi:hypothetical protein